MFYIYCGSVTGNNRLLPNKIGQLLDIDTSALTIPTGCFNGIFDGTEPPYEDVDMYIRFSNDIRVYIYGRIPFKLLKQLKNNEYVIFVLSNSLGDNLERNNRYIIITSKLATKKN